MWKYGQFCPVAHALEILGERWTLLIIRDLILGSHHFNDLQRSLPGISRGLLSKRLQHLQQAGIVEKRLHTKGRKTTEYHLTEAGRETIDIIEAFFAWGTKWAFDEPREEELDSVLLMWWLHRDIKKALLPDQQVVMQINFYGAERATYWLLLTNHQVDLCLTDPGHELNVLIQADLATFFKLCKGRITLDEAQSGNRVRIDGPPNLLQNLPNWFDWQPAA